MMTNQGRTVIGGAIVETSVVAVLEVLLQASDSAICLDVLLQNIL